MSYIKAVAKVESYSNLPVKPFKCVCTKITRTKTLPTQSQSPFSSVIIHL